jgi:hypothetical protein
MRRKTHTGYLWESQKERDFWENQDVCGWIILRWILDGYNEVVWTVLVWLRIGTSRGLLWMR